MAKQAFYAVRQGRETGIYHTWAECEANVKGYSGAEYKKFGSEEEANNYMTEKAQAAAGQKTVSSESGSVPDRHVSTSAAAKTGDRHVDVYVDGSFNVRTNEYGYAVYVNDGKREQILTGKGAQQEGGRNVEGEVAAASAALSALAKNRKYDSVTLYHDYQGIGSWADGEWKANKSYTKKYAEDVASFREQGLQVTFSHVDGHTGNTGNEYVDKLAKMACGVEITPSEREFIYQLKHVPGFPDSGQQRRQPDVACSVSVDKGEHDYESK